jgi:hypothetical protein
MLYYYQERPLINNRSPVTKRVLIGLIKCPARCKWNVDTITSFIMTLVARRSICLSQLLLSAVRFPQVRSVISL